MFIDHFILIILYTTVGVLWAEWLEQFCMKTFDGKLGSPFKPLEKFLQAILWPIFILVFIYNFLKNLTDNE